MCVFTDVSPVPEVVTTTSPTPKTIPRAQVAPMLRSKTKEELVPPAAKPAESEYVIPDVQCPDVKCPDVNNQKPGEDICFNNN